MENGLAALKVEGFQDPLTLTIGIPEATSMLYAAGLESRRPSTLRTWQQCLNVRLTVISNDPKKVAGVL